MALKRKLRLKKREFSLVKNKGKLVRGKELSLLIFFPKKEKEARFGFLLSRRVSSKAVERNKLKRQLVAVVKELLPRFQKKAWVIFLPHREMKNRNFEEIKKETEEVLKKGGLL